MPDTQSSTPLVSVLTVDVDHAQRLVEFFVHRFNVVTQDYWLGVYKVCWFDCTQVQRGDPVLLAGCVQGVLV